VTDLILHQYPLSPYSEKIRRILAYKRLPWRAVRAPAVMPKPDYVALTGGYRKVPVLQIGSDVYCDSSLIARVLDGLAPEPTLYPTPMVESVAEWVEGTAFEAVVPFIRRPTRFDEALRLMLPGELMAVGDDRAAMRAGSPKPPLPYKVAQAHLTVYLDRFERTLAAQPYLMFPAPCIVDFAVYHHMWLLEKIAPEPLAGKPHIAAWMERIAAISGAATEEISAEEALQICKAAGPSNVAGETSDDPSGLAPGDDVYVRAADYGCEPTPGKLVLLRPGEVAIRREDPRAGVVTVHFPRIGYDIVKAVA
jgi:glutathione S-transferase